ncbi:MAG: peptide chain release factor N(5)-glutamine methyltransferase [Actinomycetota bacterium]
MNAGITRLQMLNRTAELLGRVEAEILVGHVLGCSRAELYARPGELSAVDQAAALDQLAARRRDGWPLQYITGEQQFRRLNLRVGPGVLVPRPETELLVEVCLLSIAGLVSPAVVDVGTGSGAIALSIALEHPGARVWGTDVSPEALNWAEVNCERAGLPEVALLQGDLLAPVASSLCGAIDLIASNPPYLSEGQWHSAPVDVREHEPAIALRCDHQGLETSERLIAQAFGWLRPGGWLVLETSPMLAGAVRSLLLARYREVAILDDLAGHPRIARGQKP